MWVEDVRSVSRGTCAGALTDRVGALGRRGARAGMALCLLVLLGAGEAPEAPVLSKFEKGYDAYQRGAFARALDIWEPLARAGDHRAQYNMGLIYAEGRGVRQDRAKALELWTRAATGGHVRAMHNLALAYIAGVPGEKAGGNLPDYGAALKWLKKAADKDFPNSVYALGQMYQYGLGVKQNETQATALFKQSAQKGFLRAQYNLAQAYRDGFGVQKNTAQSLHWVRAAAKGGFPEAQFEMATRFSEGDGVKKNSVEALKWCLLAARHGHRKARESLGDLIVSASPDDLREAAERARQFERARHESNVD